MQSENNTKGFGWEMHKLVRRKNAEETDMKEETDPCGIRCTVHGSLGGTGQMASTRVIRNHTA